MYASHWGLIQSPFGPGLDPRDFFESAGHEEALARMHFLVDEGRRCGLLLGPSGCGKSLLFEVFAERIRRCGRPLAKLSLIGLDPIGLVAAIADQLRIRVAPGLPPWRIWQSLERRLREYRYQKLETVLLLDDADLAAAEVLTQVARLARHDLSADSRLTLILAGQTERIGRIGRAVLDLAELRIDIPAWGPRDTEAFLSGSLERAGGGGWVFAAEAIHKVHELSGGSPRKIRQLADLALLAGAGGNLEQVDAETVEAAGGQLAAIMV
ncbi:MAG: AAA family ATPase [Pirellulales bacterium]|jgi:type II secretory pathway predicted ATPase ExeA|nr:AAA family ATPase [Thermoguttaceae bacterium]MDD4788938.1 AAA family ATPase [Pirellulales bacterium]MDI9445408.1 AAA family ATPase [Planctomycetota bacterium]NLZ02664.1 AAA family ATPase [Pirellulaceae bacterium]